MSFFRRFYMRLSLIFLVLLVALAALQALVALRTFEMRRVEIDQRVNRGLAADMAGEIEPHLEEGGQPEDVGSVIHYMMVLNPAVEIYVLDAEGRILAFFAEGTRELGLEDVDLAPVRAFLEGQLLPIYGDDPRRPGTPRHFSAAPLDLGGGRSGYLYIVLQSTRYHNALAELESAYLSDAVRDAFLVTVPLVALVGLLVFFVLTRRLQALTETVRAFGRGSYAPRARETGGDEIAELAESFNAMADTIEANLAELAQADRDRRTLVASISHDLRNPLSSIRGYTETLLDKDDVLQPADRRRYLHITLDRAARLSRLIDDLFELSKLEAPDSAPRREEFSLAELAHDLVMQMQPEADARGIALTAEEPEELFIVNADVQLTERCLANLMENALHHTPAGGAVTVGVRRCELGVRVLVRDTGSGVPPGEEERIFDRFNVGEGSRSSSREGSGLGLAIAKRVVELHGGRIGIESTGPAGSVFYFEYPVGG
jgi:signal transduction histidine kinase